MLGPAEASCVSQILTAQAVASDMGESRAASSGVNSWATCHLRNSERDAHKVMKRQKTKLDIQIQTINCNGVYVPWISPETWLEFVVKKGLWPLMAGCDLHDWDGSDRNWTEFWRVYEKLNPNFELFEMVDIDLGRTAAMLVHGDEGRTLKKGGLMVTSLQSALGRGYDEKRVRGQRSDTALLRVNFAGHSFTTRYVVNTMPKTSYETESNVFYAMLDHVARSLSKCLEEGYVDDRGHRFRIVLLGVKGDAPYLSKAAHFYRSYNTTAKRGQERGPPKGVCPYCLAGTPGYPAEQVDTSKPRWLETVAVKLPWLKRPAFIRHLIHDPGDPASFFKTDIWHVFHLGFGRSWVASVVQLVLPVLPLQNLEEKWEFLTSEYLGWCNTNKKQAHISRITPYLMSYNDSSGAMGNWHKGALTTNLMQWLVDLLGKVPADAQGLLMKCRQASYRMNSMFSILYRSGAFLSEHEATFVSQQGLEFLACYSGLAAALFRDGKQWMFPLYPKLHMFHHLMLDIANQARSAKVALSPMLWACQIDEDVVGRSSRLSRRVNIRLVSQRALDRYLVAAHSAHSNAGLLV